MARATSTGKQFFPAVPALILAITFGALFAAPVRAQLSTDDHLTEPGWWPRRKPTSLKEFAGRDACAKCHSRIAGSQETTPMARTLMPIANADVFHSRSDLVFRNGKYVYRIKAKGADTELSVTDGERRLAANLLWAFGSDKLGQSYLFLQNGNYFESRVTYFSSLQNLNFTPTRELLSPHDLEEAIARPVGNPELLRCFSCHSLGTNVGGKLDTSNVTLGVTCEACHGPGLKHVQAMQASQLQQGVGDKEGRSLILDPGSLSPADSVDFCGACHGAWWDVKLSHVRGIANVRAQPYRLMSSKCWGKGDARLTCVTCHNPHEPLSNNASWYDSKCLACHLTSRTAKPTKERLGAACPVATKDCTTCHMPKIEIQTMHSTFADHLIRVVLPGEPIPD